MGGAKSPSALAPFAHDWIGGDIHGLSAYAGTLYGYVPRLSDVATALDTKVSHIVGDAGWKGSAASAFTKAWQHDATGATALAVMVSAAGDIVNTLAVNLASIESALEQAADTTAAHGVPVGAGGQPPQECIADPASESWRVSYQSFWNQSMLAGRHRAQPGGGRARATGHRRHGRRRGRGPRQGGLHRAVRHPGRVLRRPDPVPRLRRGQTPGPEEVDHQGDHRRTRGSPPGGWPVRPVDRPGQGELRRREEPAVVSPG